MSSSNGGAVGFPVRNDEVAGISSVEPSSTEPACDDVRAAFDLREAPPDAFALRELGCDSAMKQSLTCQHSQRHEPTPTNVKINDVRALITMSVLFGIGSLEVTMIGGSSEYPDGGQLT